MQYKQGEGRTYHGVRHRGASVNDSEWGALTTLINPVLMEMIAKTTCRRFRSEAVMVNKCNIFKEFYNKRREGKKQGDMSFV